MGPRAQEAAFDLEALYCEHADAVFTLAWRITGSREDAEDVLQDLFVGLPRALASYREQGRFEGWLKRIAARLALMRLRAARRRSEVSLQDTGDLPLIRAPHPIAAIALERAIQSLPEPLRLVFVLREVEGFSHQEIGDLLGISAINSATRLNRAWTALRKRES
ncbi:MAG: sigma-70 family RNA polymerase sigma factor [Gemmatimonadota bacterium]